MKFLKPTGRLYWVSDSGFPPSDMAEEFFENTSPKLSFGMLHYFLKTKIQAFHIREPDGYASGKRSSPSQSNCREKLSERFDQLLKLKKERLR
jgi:hypothetical protein